MEGEVAFRLKVGEELSSVLFSQVSLRQEIRTWLVETVGLCKLTDKEKTTLFLRLIRLHDYNGGEPKSPSSHELLSQVLSLICEVSAKYVIRMLDKDGRIIKRFFQENPKKIPLWFKHFSGPGEKEHKFGAKALSQFFFANRNEYWQDLCWAGKHAQSPVSVAARMHYFCELNVEKTVQNMIDRIPEFWSSDALWDSLKNGEIVALDPSFFVEEIQYKLSGKAGRQDEDEAWHLVEDFLEDCQFSTLCNRILHLVQDSELLHFVNKVGSLLAQRQRGFLENIEESKMSNKVPPLRPEYALLGGVSWTVFEDALLACSCLLYSHRILKILSDPDHYENSLRLRGIMDENGSKGALSLNGESLEGLTAQDSLDTAVTLTAVDCFILRYRLDSAVDDALRFESLMRQLRITATPSYEEHLSTQKTQSRKRKGKKRRKKKHSKRGRNDLPSDRDDSDSNGSLEFEEVSSSEMSRRSVAGWRITLNSKTDLWSKVELKEEFPYFYCSNLLAVRKRFLSNQSNR